MDGSLVARALLIFVVLPSGDHLTSGIADHDQCCVVDELVEQRCTGQVDEIDELIVGHAHRFDTRGTCDGDDAGRWKDGQVIEPALFDATRIDG